ncbi:PRTRC system ParB family protein [Paraburkholderia sp.]|uniref:PRTRC system ParB family protein n=1 Tax=Paraburkholderia sp. TaxID=1926495 RepID=UPI003C7E0578
MQQTIPLNRIKVLSNPRKYFDPLKMAEMEASVRETGVIQPILVRPSDDGNFIVIAGERRYRAAMTVHGELYEIPAMVHDVDEATAKSMALIENIQRQDMSPAEEAVSAAEQVGLLKGDRDEAARILGWNRQTLDKRLALMNCTPSVLEALTNRQILLGHAELFAAFTKENQDKLLPVIIAEKRSIADLKTVLERAACALSAAIFDKADCAACPHNSSAQSEMFGESIATGNCTNRGCYNDKTEKALEAQVESMKDEYPVVRIVRAGDNETRVQLTADGPKGVGAEQVVACHGCQSYGAAVSGLPDSLGKVYRGQCFDTVCNMKKVAARIKAEKTAQQPASPAAGKAATAPAKKVAGAAGAAPAPTQAATVVSESERVKAYRVKLWRKALRKDIGLDHGLAREYLIGLVMTGHARDIDGPAYRGLLAKGLKLEVPESDIAEAINVVKGVPSDRQVALITAMLFTAIEGLAVHNLTALCKAHGLDLTKHWKLDKEFLELVTKAEMMVIADELGIRAALGENFKKVFAKSKGEVIDALLAVEGFDYTGKLLKILQF